MRRVMLIVVVLVLAACEVPEEMQGRLGDVDLSGLLNGGATGGAPAGGIERGRCFYYAWQVEGGVELHRDCEIDGSHSEVVVPPEWRRTTFTGDVDVPPMCLHSSCIEAGGLILDLLATAEFDQGALHCERRVTSEGACEVCVDLNPDWQSDEVPCHWRGGVWAYYPAVPGDF